MFLDTPNTPRPCWLRSCPADLTTRPREAQTDFVVEGYFDLTLLAWKRTCRLWGRNDWLSKVAAVPWLSSRLHEGSTQAKWLFTTTCDQLRMCLIFDSDMVMPSSSSQRAPAHLVTGS